MVMRMREHAKTILPRGLIFLASAWLLSSWLIAVGVKPPIHPSSNTYTPAAQVLLASIVLGGVVGWPLLRLSGPVFARPVVQPLLDMISLFVLLQIVIWPLRLVTMWTVSRIILIDLSLSAWLATCGALICIGAHTRNSRTIAMVAIVAWLLGPLMLAALETTPSQYLQASPLGAIWSLSAQGGALTQASDWLWLLTHWVIAVTVWVLAAFLGPSRRVPEKSPLSEGGGPPHKKVA